MIDLEKAYQSLKAGENHVWHLTEHSSKVTSARRMYSLADAGAFVALRLRDFGLGSLEAEHWAEILTRERRMEWQGYRWTLI